MQRHGLSACGESTDGSHAARCPPVDKLEAVLAAESRKLRSCSYSELVERLLDRQESLVVAAASGVGYQIEFQAFWDDASSGNLRVLGAIDDGGWRAFAPLSEDFIVAPDGSFVGE
jgi:hypothetical protein